MKKGVFFTLIGLLLIILIVSSVVTKEKYRYRERSNAVSSRVMSMNSFIDDFEKDLVRELFIGGYRALISMNTYTRNIQGFIPNFNEVFSEILVNGTANGTFMELMEQSGQAAYLSGWLERINIEAEKIGIRVAMEVNDIQISHTSPWTVQILLNATSNISDIRGTAGWTFTKVYNSEFSILGLEDPLYTVMTRDVVVVSVNISPYTVFVVNETKDVSELISHITNRYYVASEDAPSFIMRFSGNLSPSDFGIESLVDVVELSAQGFYRNRSVVDYIYFGNQITNDYCNVELMHPRFRIDDGHSAFYGVDHLDKSSCS